MSKKNLIFGVKETNKNTFNKCKQPVDISKEDTNKIVISDKGSNDKKGFIKYFIGYKSNNVIRPLYIKLAQIRRYVRYFDDGGKNMSCMAKNNKLKNI